MFSPTRRTFLQTAVVPLFLPWVPTTKEKPTWFLHKPTGDSWAVDDPVTWCLENAHQPILERARERLLKLSAADPQRMIRLVTRRCQLNMIEVDPGKVVVHYWGQQGQADLRPFFKKHRLAHKGVQVLLTDRKRETSTIQHGDDFLYGEPVVPFEPWEVFWTKWQRRHIKEANDWTAAPFTWSGYAWEGVKPKSIPWAAMKSAWRRAAPMLCLNCDTPTILTNFGLPQYGLFNHEAWFIYTCRQCHRRFRDHSIDRLDVERWLVSNLDAEVLPDYSVWCGQSVQVGATRVKT